MAKSRLALWAVLALLPAPALAQPVSAEQAIERQREALVRGTRLECPRGEGEDVVVCGRREREILPFDRTGEPTNLMPGETMSTREALAATTPSSCSTTGPNQRCGGGLPVVQALMLLAKIGKHLIDPDE